MKSDYGVKEIIMQQNNKTEKRGRKKNMSMQIEGESEWSMTMSVAWTCCESEVFRRCNLHRFRSLWQNIGPPAHQLMWVKLRRTKNEKQSFKRAWDLRPVSAPSTPLTVWHLCCVWVHMCALQPEGLKQLSVLRKIN